MSGADEYVLDSDDEPLMGMSDWTPPRVPVQPMVSLRRMKRRTECGADLMAAAVGTLGLPPFFYAGTTTSALQTIYATLAEARGVVLGTGFPESVRAELLHRARVACPDLEALEEHRQVDFALTEAFTAERFAAFANAAASLLPGHASLKRLHEVRAS